MLCLTLLAKPDVKQLYTIYGALLHTSDAFQYLGMQQSSSADTMNTDISASKASRISWGSSESFPIIFKGITLASYS